MKTIQEEIGYMIAVLLYCSGFVLAVYLGGIYL